ncbi:UNVERIFIED_CONTAM: hypothetical protein Sradi_6155000 [Sesamum radiatum]|uniref:Uncharacterized protein n=1 Tax=Sesamum radiatum TaxID=300843 RepID=A0AAW2K895_SESRA
MPISRDYKGWRTCFRSLFPAASLLFVVLFIWNPTISQHSKEVTLRPVQPEQFKGSLSIERNTSKFTPCRRRPPGRETLPKGIVAETSNLERRPLWGLPKKTNTSTLLAISVGIKQKENVDKMVQKFLGSNFAVMLFHYDGVVDEWKAFEWSRTVIHVSADNQTKCLFLDGCST